MDLTRGVAYRGFALNTVVNAGGNAPLDGCQIDNIEYYQVDAFGYREKRSLSDGLDASDVFLGARSIRISGTLYGQTRADLYDSLAAFRAALMPTSAYLESPGDLGYLPLTFEEATLNTVNWPTGYITKMIRVRAMGTPRFYINRDKVGGETSRGYSIGWDVVFEAKDPRIYYQSFVQTFFNAAGNTASGAGTVTNRGPYPTPLKIEIFVPLADADRVVTLTAFGSVTKITVPNSANDATARYDGYEKYLTLTQQGVEVLRMDLLDFPSGVDHPLVPYGASAYTWTSKTIAGVDANINGTSRFWFWEAWP